MRPKRVRALRMVGVLASASGCSGSAGAGDCPAPSFAATSSNASPDQGPLSAAAGEQLTLSGVGFLDGCTDSIVVAGDGPGSGPAVESPEVGVTLALAGAGTSDAVVLATIDADADGRWGTTVTLPDVAPGDYVLTASPADPLPITLS